MTLDTVILISLDVADKFYFLWNVYLAFILASVGWLASLKRDLNTQAKIIVSFAMIAIFSINMLSIHRNLEVLELTLDELSVMVKGLTFSHPTTHAEFDDLISMRWHHWLSYPVHLFFDGLLLFLVWNNKVWARFRSSSRRE